MKIRYFLSETVNNLRRNALMAVAATSTVAISLLLLGGVEILGMVVGNVTNSWEAKVEISTFLRDDASSGEIQALESEVAQMPEVKDVTYVSKAQAYEEFKETYADTPQLYEALSPDSLPASLRIALTDAQYTQEVAARIQGASGVDEVRFGGEIIRRLLQVNTLLRTVTLVLSVILMIASAALIANTIRLGIYARREEIGIMKLVGATNWFIRIPFMLEGLVAALLGALLAAGIVWFADAMLFTRLAQAVPFLAPAFNFSTRELMTVVAALVAVGTGVGLVGSGMATRRFLQV
ncbi:MAG: ABC transporter permease [Actinobacteria bacterium]|jgi:cell division transport system permease protein|nr:ABC transporter permease [Actinomycetota bacterium]MDQ3530813.1 permease-like cell division protein FtsX [Actinomycetota bacterium]